MQMTRRASHVDSPYGVARPLGAIGDGWSLLIVRDVFDGLRRFGEFQRSLGLSKNIPAVRLRNLVIHDTPETVPASGGSAYQDYVLTEKGHALFPLLVALWQWGEVFCFVPDEAHVVLVDKVTSKLVPRLELHAQGGRALALEDMAAVHPSAIRPTKRQRAKAG